MDCIQRIQYADPQEPSAAAWARGALMNPGQLALLDRYACTTVPNGNYWLNVQTGLWGYAHNPQPVGYIGAACGSGGGGGRPSLSERGMLYSSSPWGRGR